MIHVHDLVFEYPDKRVLHGLHLDVERESVTALVGPNGSGKSTLMRCIAALLEPAAGTIEVAGVDAIREPRRCHRRLGYLSDFFGLYADLSVRRSLIYMARAYAVSEAEVPAAVERAARRTGITSFLETATQGLSRGYRQRVAIAQAIIHEPAVLLLDEPASGLDPEARSELAALFRELRAQGMTLLVSSHILAELEEYSTHMVVLRAGRIIERQGIASDAPPGEPWVLELAGGASGPACDALGALPGVSEVTADGAAIHFRLRGGAAERARILQALIGEGHAVSGLRPGGRDMQRAYLDLLRDEAAT